MHEMQTIVIDVSGVCLSVCLSHSSARLYCEITAERIKMLIGWTLLGASGTLWVLNMGPDPPTARGRGDLMQPLPNYFGLLLSLLVHVYIITQLWLLVYQCSWLSGKTRLWNDLLCVELDMQRYLLTLILVFFCGYACRYPATTEHIGQHRVTSVSSLLNTVLPFMHICLPCILPRSQTLNFFCYFRWQPNPLAVHARLLLCRYVTLIITEAGCSGQLHEQLLFV